MNSPCVFETVFEGPVSLKNTGPLGPSTMAASRRKFGFLSFWGDMGAGENRYVPERLTVVILSPLLVCSFALATSEEGRHQLELPYHRWRFASMLPPCPGPK